MSRWAALLQSPAFRLFWIGEAISVLGDQFYLVALPLLTFDLTKSPAALGAVLMTAAIPRALLIPVGGVLVDRFSPQRVFLASSALRGLIVGALTLLVFTHSLSLWHLFALSALFGVVDALAFPAFMSLPPRMVDESRLERANAAIQGTAQLSGMLGPALAGVLIAATGVPLAFAIDTASFCVSALTLWWMIRLLPLDRHVPAAVTRATTGKATPSAPGDAVRSLRAAVLYTWRDPVLRTVLMIVAAINVGVLGPIGVGLPSLALRELHGDSRLLGLVMGIFGAGTLAGTLLAAFARRPTRAGRVTSWSTWALATAMGLVGLGTRTPWPTIIVPVMLLAAGIALGYLNIIGISWLQARVPAEMMGRVMAFMILAANGLVPFSYALSGLVAERDVVYLFVGGAAAVSAAWLAAQGQQFRSATWGVAPSPKTATAALASADPDPT